MAAAAADFAQRWAGRGYEKGESQIFWADLLTNVFGVEDIADFIRYEEKVKVDKTNEASKGIYTINGVRLNATSAEELPAGLYIIDGQKVVVK